MTTDGPAEQSYPGQGPGPAEQRGRLGGLDGARGSAPSSSTSCCPALVGLADHRAGAAAELEPAGLGGADGRHRRAVRVHPGQAALGIRVVPLGGGSLVGLWAMPRTALIFLIVPPLVVNADGRGPARPAVPDDRAADPLSLMPVAPESGRRRGQRTPHGALHVALLDAGRHRALGQPGLRRAGRQRVEPVVQVDDSGGGMLRGSFIRYGVQLAQRDLALFVADDDVIDRGVTDDPGDPLLLLRQQRLHPVRRALADQDDARPADRPGGPRPCVTCRRSPG